MKKEEVKLKDRDIYIFGHLNPDTDSICTTLAYARLKEKLGYTKIHACRLGELNKETTYVLNKLGIEPPMLIDCIKPQISDLDYYDTDTIKENEDIRTAREKMIVGGSKKRLLPVVGENGELIGVVSNSNMMKSIERFYKLEEMHSDICMNNLIKNLEATDVIGKYDEFISGGKVYVDTIAINKKVNDNDIVIATNEEITKMIIEKNNKFILIIPHANNKFLSTNDFKNVFVIRTKMKFSYVLYMIAQSASMHSIMSTDNIEFFETDEYIEDIKPIVVESKLTHFPIIDKNNKVHGVLSRRHLLKFQKKNVILIDHNEVAQSVKGLKESNILEIIDHHKIDTVSTEFPPLLRMEPVGCTSTIVYKLYKENRIEIDKISAMLMLSAILSDTLILHSPTCTPKDMEVANKLAKIANVDINKYGQDMISASFDVTDSEWETLIRSDIKRFKIKEYDVQISNVNIANYEDLLYKKEFLKEKMENIIKNDGADTLILMLTDIINQGSWIICVGKDKKLFNLAFGIEDDNIFLPGVLSRKKQVLPKVMATIEKIN